LQRTDVHQVAVRGRRWAGERSVGQRRAVRDDGDDPGGDAELDQPVREHVRGRHHGVGRGEAPRLHGADLVERATSDGGVAVRQLDRREPAPRTPAERGACRRGRSTKGAAPTGARTWAIRRCAAVVDTAQLRRIATRSSRLGTPVDEADDLDDVARRGLCR
jgi:hypothetical protein